MSFSHEFPLRISLPAALLGVGLLLASIFMLWSLHAAEEQINEEISLLLQDKAGEVTAGLEANQLLGQSALHRELAALSRQRRLQVAVLLNPEWRIELAQEAGLHGKTGSGISGFQADQASMALQQQRPVVARSGSGQQISVYLAMAMPAALTSQYRRGVLWLQFDVRDIEQRVRRGAALRATVLAILLISMGALLAWQLRRRIGTRLATLAQAAGQLADGIPQPPVSVGGNDEIAQLASSFNRMTAALASAEQQRLESQAALRRSEQRYRSLFESSKDFIAIFNPALDHVDANPAYLHMLGYTLDEVRQRGYLDVAAGSHSQAELDRLQVDIFQRGYSDEFESSMVRKDGSRCPVSIKAILLRGPDGKPETVWGIGRDISARKKTEAALKLSAKVYAASHEGIIVTDPERIILTANPAYEEITGYPPEETIGHKPQFLLSDHYNESFYNELLATVSTEGFWQGEILGRRKNGELYPVWVTISTAQECGKLENYIITFSDITERKQTEDHIRHLAEHDFLTDLPNRVLLMDRLSQTMAHSRRGGNPFALMFIDLDRFKQINDTLGHHIGDMLLQAVAGRLKTSLRDSDTVSRQGGDEFVILLPQSGSIEELDQLAGRLMRELTRPYQLEAHEFSVTASIGIAVFPHDGNDIDTLVRNADTAMYHAKQNGRNHYQFFAESMNAQLSERLLLENRLRRAMEAGHLRLYYQPKVAVDSQQIVGAEALLRWIDPEQGTISPARFIPAAEESGLIIELGDWVLNTACRQAREWLARGLQNLVVSVNVSAVQFRQPDLPQTVARALQASGLPPGLLELELTEGMLMEQPELATESMRALKEMGVRLSLDDFGTGYSSLSYLKRFPFDTLKIDQSFIRDLHQGKGDESLVRTIILMAKNLNMRAVAEGVETAQQLAFLTDNQCDEFQGFLRSRAVPADEFEQLLSLPAIRAS